MRCGFEGRVWSRGWCLASPVLFSSSCERERQRACPQSCRDATAGAPGCNVEPNRTGGPAGAPRSSAEAIPCPKRRRPAERSRRHSRSLCADSFWAESPTWNPSALFPRASRRASPPAAAERARSAPSPWGRCPPWPSPFSREEGPRSPSSDPFRQEPAARP